MTLIEIKHKHGVRVHTEQCCSVDVCFAHLELIAIGRQFGICLLAGFQLNPSLSSVPEIDEWVL